MAAIVQVLLPLICIALAEAQFSFNLPFFGLPPPHRGVANGPMDSNEDHFSHEAWFHHDWPRHIHRLHDKFNPFLHRGREPYYEIGPYDMDDIGSSSEMNNMFNTPGYNSHKRKLSHHGHNKEPKIDHNVASKGKTSDDKSQDVSPTVNKPQDDNPQINTTESNLQHNLDDNSSKTSGNQMTGDNGEKDKKNVDIGKKKDYLLVGQGNNGNNVYLLHENKPNPTTVVIPNSNQPGSNVIYIPYNSGQPTNQVYQVVNARSIPANGQMAENKINVNGYNNPEQNTLNSNSNQNPGYVMVYSNGQLLKIPGVVVNSVQNNVPLQNGYPVQGTQYIIANSVPTNSQNEPVVPNPSQISGKNVIYATLPNQQPNGPIVLQIPNYVQGIANNHNCEPGAVVQNPIQGDTTSAGNMGAQQVVLVQNGASNNYAQPNSMPNEGQGSTQGLPNQNGPIQPAVKEPVGCSNENNQPITNQGPSDAVNAPIQGAVMTNPNTPIQPAVEVPVNAGTGLNQGPNAAVNPASPGNQGARNAVVNAPSHDEVPDNNGIVSDNSNMSAVGAHPAVMITDFKDPTAVKKDIKKRRRRNHRSNRKDKKNKHAANSNESGS